MVPRLLFIPALCLALSGCYVKSYGVQSTGGGATATTTSTQVGGTAKFSGGRATFVSGQPVSPSAPGGHVRLGSGATVALIAGIALADFFSYIRGEPRPKDLDPGEKIMETCSCYRKQPAD
jgi:hypothetical protein